MELMRFRTPTGWRVLWNAFYDIDTIDQNVPGDAEIAFTQDLLALDFKGRSAANVVYAIYLGWYPDRNPNGTFCLTLLNVSSDEELATYEHRDHVNIRNKFEAWLEYATRAKSRRELERLLRRSATGD